MNNMKTKLNKLAFALILTMGLLTFGCADLVVENLNEPDSSKALANPDDLTSLAGGAFRTLHNAMQEYDGPALSMVVMADQGTCSWGNAAMNDLSHEPRTDTRMVNSLTYAYFPIIRVFWEDSYASISAVNDVLRAIEEKGIQMGEGGADTEMVRAWSYFVSGVAHGYLGLTYDQGNLIKWDTDLETLELTPWQTLIDGSLELLDQAISIANGNSFEIPAKWLGGESYTNAELSQLASTYAARILTYSSRNKAHNEGIDWNKVLSYASNGIQKPLKPELGDNYDFYDMYLVYQRYPGWGRVDHRIINLMDPDYPSRWPMDASGSWTTADGQDPGQAESDDARLLSDFGYLPENAFPADRGYYHWSHYRYKRYDDVFTSVWYGSKPKSSMLVWENEMLKAEAMVRTGNVAGAVSILNDPNGSRKLRGQLPDVTATSAPDVLWTIFYERDVDLMDSGMGIGFFDMRRRDMLQRGTILHYPVPMTELEIIQAPIYTIGGTEPDGENVSNGSWTGRDGLTSPPSN
jgi:starch-binding outer membrane protein, SusD/RagB family